MTIFGVEPREGFICTRHLLLGSWLATSQHQGKFQDLQKIFLTKRTQRSLHLWRYSKLAWEWPWAVFQVLHWVGAALAELHSSIFSPSSSSPLTPKGYQSYFIVSYSLRCIHTPVSRSWITDGVKRREKQQGFCRGNLCCKSLLRDFEVISEFSDVQDYFVFGFPKSIWWKLSHERFLQKLSCHCKWGKFFVD